MARVYLSLGSNLEPRAHLADALGALRERFGVLSVSPVYRSAAVGFTGPEFLNLAVGLDTDLPPAQLDAWLRALEAGAGRRRDGPRFSSRTLDIDIVLYDALVLDGPGHLQIPRAELVAQAFVLKPMVDIAGHVVHPTLGVTLSALWDAFEGDKSLKGEPGLAC